MDQDEIERRRALRPEQSNNIVLSRSIIGYPIISFLNRYTRDEQAPPKQINNEYQRFTVWYSGPTTRVVRRTFADAGFTEAPEESIQWHLSWGSPKGVAFYQTLAPGQYCNEIPGSNSMGRKDMLAEFIEKRELDWPEEFDIIPKTFIIPQSLPLLLSEFSSYPNSFYIYKPAMGARGNGIELLQGKDGLKDQETIAVVQDYLSNPLLLHGFKFDFRIYACVTSTDPLIVYVYSNGLGRFATSKYHDPTPGNKANITMHLTNFSVNGKSKNFCDETKGFGAVKAAQDGTDRPVNNDDDEPVDIMDNFPSKWQLPELLQYLDDHADHFANCSFKKGSGELKEYIEQQIVLLVKKTFIACEPRLFSFAHEAGTANCYPRRNFGMYGFDMILTDELKLLLIEVNSSPATGTATELDVKLKFPLCAELMQLIGMPATFRENGQIYVPKRFVDEESRKEYYESSTKVAGEFTGPICFSSTVEKIINSVDFATLTDFEKRCLLELKDEEKRLGGWVRALPDGNVDDLRLYENQRYLNTLATEFIAEGANLQWLQ